MNFYRRYGLYFAWLFSLIGVIWSLYFSDIRHIEPCFLCWFQRIALFPLAIILGIATYRGDLGIGRYLLPQVIIGLMIAGYQIALQEIPGWYPIEMCGSGPSCSERSYIGLGPITIPMLSALAFALIALLLIGAYAAREKD
ncbi:MAG: disulfide bond formation protein B [Chlamydiia bacterium]|nr:disulfide bond formation protein B [Chlamydiia bacterium]